MILGNPPEKQIIINVAEPYHPVRIGHFEQALRELNGEPDKMYVQLGILELVGTKIDSWRGAYKHAALGYRTEQAGWDTDNPMRKVADYLREIERAYTETFEGYKGGDFRYGSDTYLFIANWGESTMVSIQSLELRTGYQGPDHEKVFGIKLNLQEVGY